MILTGMLIKMTSFGKKIFFSRWWYWQRVYHKEDPDQDDNLGEENVDENDDRDKEDVDQGYDLGEENFYKGDGIVYYNGDLFKEDFDGEYTTAEDVNFGAEAFDVIHLFPHGGDHGHHQAGNH